MLEDLIWFRIFFLIELFSDGFMETYKLMYLIIFTFSF